MTRCPRGFPSVIATAPVLPDGAPFPTLFWLTCPWLCAEAARRESAGETALWATRAAADPALAASLRGADASYRAARAAEAGGADPAAATGIAGQRDPLGVKCLHAHVAAALAGMDDPVGLAILSETGPVCAGSRCLDLDADAASVPPGPRRW